MTKTNITLPEIASRKEWLAERRKVAQKGESLYSCTGSAECRTPPVADAPNLPFDKERSDVQKHQVSESGPPFE